MFYEEDDDSEDYLDEQIKLWQEDELTRYINSFQRILSNDERINLELDIIEKYFPGLDNLTDDELVRQKCYPSRHSFQYAVSVKRMAEESGRGIVFSAPNRWHFGFGAGI